MTGGRRPSRTGRTPGEEGRERISEAFIIFMFCGSQGQTLAMCNNQGNECNKTTQIIMCLLSGKPQRCLFSRRERELWWFKVAVIRRVIRAAIITNLYTSASDPALWAWSQRIPAWFRCTLLRGVCLFVCLCVWSAEAETQISHPSLNMQQSTRALGVNSSAAVTGWIQFPCFRVSTGTTHSC